MMQVYFSVAWFLPKWIFNLSKDAKQTFHKGISFAWSTVRTKNVLKGQKSWFLAKSACELFLESCLFRFHDFLNILSWQVWSWKPWKKYFGQSQGKSIKLTEWNGFQNYINFICIDSDFTRAESSAQRETLKSEDLVYTIQYFVRSWLSFEILEKIDILDSFNSTLRLKTFGAGSNFLSGVFTRTCPEPNFFSEQVFSSIEPKCLWSDKDFPGNLQKTDSKLAK